MTVIDELPFGGTCALRGCDPEKILRRGAEIIDAARLMRGKGGRDRRGVSVNAYLQSVSNPIVYAAGDATDTDDAPRTLVAVFEDKVAATNMLKGNHAEPDYRGVPSVVFTIPELARVGMLETEANETGRNIRIALTGTNSCYSNLRAGGERSAIDPPRHHQMIDGVTFGSR